MRGLSALLFAVMTVASPAAAGVVVREGVPFTSGELTAALAVRDAAAPTDVLVEVPPGPAAGPSVDVLVTTSAGAWTIALGDARGPSAARLVALHLLDTALPLPAPAPPSARVAAVPLETPPALDAAVEPPAAPAPSSRWMTVAAGGGRGVDGDDLPGGTLAFELAAARGTWLGGVELSWQSTAASEARSVGTPITTSMGQLRAVVGVRSGPVELVTGPFAGVLFLDEVPGARARMMTGLGAAVRLRQALPAAGWSLQLAGGADAYRHRVMVEASGTPLASTPRVALLLTVGLSRELGR